MSKYFTVTPKHWWSYLNPFWWRTKRIVEAVVNHEYEKHKPEIEKAIQDAYLYGTGILSDYKHVEFNGIWKDEEPPKQERF